MSHVSIDAIRRELARRQSKLTGLERHHRALSRRLAAVEAKILAAGGEISSAGPGRRGGGRRARNKVSLGEALKAVLKGKKLGVQETIDAVLKSGYMTTSANFRNVVALRLGKTKGIKRVERGVYTA